MVRIRVYRRQNEVHRVLASGHAGYAKAGQDVVCAAASILLYNAVNSCEQFCSVLLDARDDGDVLDISVPSQYVEQADVQLLLQSMVFGLQQIQQQYPKFLRLEDGLQL